MLEISNLVFDTVHRLIIIVSNSVCICGRLPVYEMYSGYTYLLCFGK